MLLLAFDTSTPAVTVALHDGTQVLVAHTVVDARRHGELLAPGIAHVLADAGRSASDLTGIAVGVGPGPFTGLRIGLMTARAMGDALRDSGHRRLHPRRDRRGGRRASSRFWSPPMRAVARSTGPPMTPSGIAHRRSACRTTGGRRVARGCVRCGRVDVSATRSPMRDEPEYPDAGVLASMVANGRAVVLPPDPLYLRRPDAVEPSPRRPVAIAV